MKILLLGKNGLVGSALLSVFLREEVIAPSHAECDITDFAATKSFVHESHPDLVINATGYTAVDRAETEEALSQKINGDAAGELAGICSELSIPLVHFSTDYVFNGEKEGGYIEDDLPAPINAYGRTKLSGEMLLQKNTPFFFLVRTSWLFGPALRGKNFVDTILRLAKTQPTLRIVNDQFGKPTYSLDLAQAVYGLIKTKEYGIYHIVNEGVTSWSEYASSILRIAGSKTPITPIPSADFPQAARRPTHSALINTKLPQLRHHEEAVLEYLKTII
ncbi:MAG: dTDP-4-dehydrorhamnose reductase [Patescibacteria group bacterium]